MTVKLVLSGPMQRPKGLEDVSTANPLLLEVAEGASVADVAQKAGFSPTDLRFFRAALDGELATMQSRTKPDVTVTLILSVGGG